MGASSRAARIAAVKAARLSRVCLVLEDVHDPHNAGAVLRTAEGFGIEEVHFLFLQERPYSPAKATRGTAMSAERWLSLFVWQERDDLLAHLRKERFRSWALVPPGQSGGHSVWEVSWCDERKIALWVGNEHRGLAPETVDALEGSAHIPMWGFVRSFNLSVALAVALAEVVRQMRMGGTPIALRSTLGVEE